MITSDNGLRLALEQLGQAYLAIASLRAEHPNAKPEWPAVMAEGFIDHARQLQCEIDAYTGIAALAKDGNGKAGETRDAERPGGIPTRCAGTRNELRPLFRFSYSETTW